MSTIAAIIPTYNRAWMLRECIESLLAQTRALHEIIVVNDGSTDDTQQIAASYAPRVTLINKANSGKAASLNAALAQCTADYVWICDDDDLAAPDGAANLASALDADPAIGFAFGTFQIFKDTSQGRVFFPPTYWRRNEEPNASLNFLEEMFTFQYAMMVRRPLYNDVGPFREDLIRSQDYDMTLRLTRKYKSAYVPHIIFSQRQHTGVRGSASDHFSAEKNAAKWLTYEQKIFTSIMQDYRLEEFTPTFALSLEATLARRAAFVQRALVLAKRALWEPAINDLREASLQNASPASAEEIRLAESIIRSLIPWTILRKNPTATRALQNCYYLTPFTQTLIPALCRPIVWQARTLLRHGRLIRATKQLILLVKILGPKGAAHRILASVLGRA